MRCATHPNVETNLRCGKCGKPICPKCMVQTAVGSRCPECTNLYKLPVFHISAQYYLRAIGAGLIIAIGYGIAWGVIEWIIPFLSFNLLLGPGAGYIIGEIISRSVNRKRGTGLAIIGGIAVTISYLISLQPPWGYGFSFFSFNFLHLAISIIALALGIYFAVTRLR
ncbi:MAG: B-box zinc finger protein [Dehalococcoidales bacterium]|nr:B-box zinc finger protein [Dehalococcoidales bacterium]